MKQKTSITLSEDIVSEIDRLAGRGKRSHLIESALREYVQRRARALRDRQDRKILDRSAKSLNREAGDVLSYQIEV